VKRSFALVLILTQLAGVVCAEKKKEKLEVTSPDKQLAIKIAAEDKLYYSVIYKGTEVIMPSAIAMTLKDRVLGTSPQVKRTSKRSVRETIAVPYGNFTRLEDHFNELVVEFSGDYALVLRAYNDGVAYRFRTSIGAAITVVSEQATFKLPGDPAATFPESDVFTSWEVPYVEYTAVSAIGEGKKALTPSLFSYKNNVRVIVAESDVRDYPGMYVQKSGDVIKGTWSRYPKRTELGSWGNFVSVVKETEDFIADTQGAREFPWRVIIATDDDKRLLTNDIVYKLAPPSKLQDVSWIKPGKAAWEWWHDAMLPGAAIPSGMDNRNTALYKYYIDFAAANHLEFLMIDAGWSNIFDLSRVNPKVDVQELIRYGKEKNVGLFLWCVATTLVKDLDKNMALLEQWGAVGLKVDFIDRDDQLAIRWFEDIAAAAARHKLMVNFHGCSKPTGVERAYPNIVNYEAARGAECSKWDYTANPNHHLVIPFLRMIAGPLDYTPGSMRNKNKSTFRPIDPGLPSTQGTRCHELAMYVLFDQPFAMLCDSPTEYEKYPDLMQYLAAVPTTFEDTRVLDARFGQYAVEAKRKGDAWFVGAMTNWDAREVELDFSFLPEGKTYQASLYTDGADASTDASRYDYKTIAVDRKSKIRVKLAEGGGAVAYLRP
jgi:alpha-glucosidase